MLKSQKISQVFGFLVILCLLFSMITPISVFAGSAGDKYAFDEDKSEFIGGGVGDLSDSDITEAIKYANGVSGQTKTTDQEENDAELYVKIKGTPYVLLKADGAGVSINKVVWSDA